MRDLRYLRRAAPKHMWPQRPGWEFRTIREHWDASRKRLPKEFPVFAPRTGMNWSDALLCIHPSLLHAERPVDWYGLAVPTANTVNDLLGASAIKKGVFERLGYLGSDGRPLRLTTHQARHYLSTLAERGAMVQEDLAKWAGRAQVTDNRVYNHMSEAEHVKRAREALTGTSLAACEPPDRPFVPVTPAECNWGERGPTHRTEFGYCEHDWVMSPCTKHRDCVNCTEHVVVKGDAEAQARLRAAYDHHVVECTKALDAVLDGAAAADRWLEHALKSLVRQRELLDLMDSDAVADGASIRLEGPRAEHTHLGRALDQRLPRLRDSALPASVTALISRYLDGESLDDAARRADCQPD